MQANTRLHIKAIIDGLIRAWLNVVGLIFIIVSFTYY